MSKKKTKKPGPAVRYPKQLTQMRVTQEDYDLLHDAVLHRIERTGTIEFITDFIRRAIHDAAKRELGK